MKLQLIKMSLLLMMNKNAFAQKKYLSQKREAYPIENLNCKSPSKKYSKDFGDTTEEFICAASGFSSVGSFLSNPNLERFSTATVTYNSLNRNIKNGSLTAMDKRIHFLLSNPPRYERNCSIGQWFRWSRHPFSPNLYNSVSKDYPSDIFLPNGQYKYLSIFEVTDPNSRISQILPLSKIDGIGPNLGGVPDVREGIAIPGRWKIKAKSEQTIQCYKSDKHIVQKLQQYNFVDNKTLELYDCREVNRNKHLFYLSNDSGDKDELLKKSDQPNGSLMFKVNITRYTQVQSIKRARKSIKPTKDL